ncbi:helix-turn-helix domain-containing protein [Mangrovibacterium lignilyticum]|uniref:helix-turn-helix domain-containing protein n=1 Tax=Mangrovibacterium lignilyticum TaxID=2668052 RepID=UPI0013D3DC01|nr:helix-turn-helix domain-containing protein [Mangrovibacterium lignilyticum]
MKKEDHSKISIEYIIQQERDNIIAETNGFISSKTEMNIGKQLSSYNFPRIVEGIAFVFCTMGKARVKINLGEHDMYEKSVLVLVPNNIMQVLEHSNDFKVKFLFFTFDFFSSIRLTTQIGHIAQAVEEHPCLYPHSQDFERLITVQQLIADQYGNHIAYREEIVRNLLYALVYQILQLYVVSTVGNTKGTVNRKQDIYMKFMTLLFEHSKIERSVVFYADKLHLTRKYFSKVIFEISGKNPSAWIDEAVIMTAKALLKSSDLTATQIAFELNFSSASFFCAYFKKRVNMSPLQYREL